MAGSSKYRISRQRPLDASPPPADEFEPSLLAQSLESDRGRIIHSAAIRRLQQKTQVFPLERNAAVRSRLTHSLEVQQAGRYIVRTLFAQLGSDLERQGLAGLEGAVETLVEMACLMHDIGNPPFGHFGEFAIGQWFERHLAGIFQAAVPPSAATTELRERMLRDLQSFEGNAQALRLVVKLLRLNLTYSQTAILLKYVRRADQPRPAKDEPGAYLAKKPGFYLSEQGFVEQMYGALGMAPATRHPLVYIMEAADDIAYCLADIEDAVEKGLLGLEQVCSLLLEHFSRRASVDAPIAADHGSFAQLLEQAKSKADAEPINKVGEFFILLRVSMVRPLVQHAARQFVEHIDAVCAGTLDRALLEDDSPAHAIVRTFKSVAAERVYCHREVETLHLQGYRILQGMLDHYSPLLGLDADRFGKLLHGGNDREPHLPMLVGRLPSQLLKAYHLAVAQIDAQGEQARLWELYHRCRLLQDFVSGMTDQLAQDEYRILSAR